MEAAGQSLVPIFGSALWVIGPYAFAGCATLRSVELPNTVVSIHSHAFEGCVGLDAACREEIRRIRPDAVFHMADDGPERWWWA